MLSPPYHLTDPVVCAEPNHYSLVPHSRVASALDPARRSNTLIVPATDSEEASQAVSTIRTTSSWNLEWVATDGYSTIVRVTLLPSGKPQALWRTTFADAVGPDRAQAVIGDWWVKYCNSGRRQHPVPSPVSPSHAPRLTSSLSQSSQSDNRSDQGSVSLESPRSISGTIVRPPDNLKDLHTLDHGTQSGFFRLDEADLSNAN
ncbi:hypothetical protein LTR41_011391 [Exophiala xenobiotica]|nr:hypothetical protein LTR41_011391 [Exophiala xenobiotica]KAK5550508.1 hypothetical protein LTR46_011488 [Exophiala xenobiotica]